MAAARTTPVPHAAAAATRGAGAAPARPARAARAAPRAAATPAAAARRAPLRAPDEPTTPVSGDVARGDGSARFAEDGAVYSEDFRVRCYECDPSRAATLETVMNLLQECAVNHAVAVFGDNEGGFATDKEMIRLNLMFVMSKMHLRIGAYPAWNNDVRCDTWFAISGKLAARRDWMLYSADGAQALAASTSTWLLVNTETRKLGRIPPERIEAYKELTPTEPLHALDADEEKLAPRPPQEGDDAQALVASLGMGVRRTDTDMNQHVNNVAYIRWLLEAVPSDYFDSHVLTGITLEFRNECHYGESINAWVTAEATVAEGGSVTAAEEGEEVLYHWLHSDDNDKELMRAKTFWRPR